jgi:hypothetical protein
MKIEWPIRLGAQQDNHFSNELIHIDRLPPHGAFLEQHADAADDVGRAGDVGDHSRCRLARLDHLRVLAAKPSQAGLRIGDGRGNRLLDLVRQRRGQLSHCGHTVDVRLSAIIFDSFRQ